MTGPKPSITRCEHQQTRFERIECAPSPILAGLIHRYTGYSHTGPSPRRRREPAQGMVTIILNFGPTLRVRGACSFATKVSSFIAALHSSYAITEEEAISSGVQIDLSPLGAHMLLGIPMRDLSQLVLPLEDVTDLLASTLVERLFLAQDWAARFQFLDAFICGRIAEAQPPSPDVAYAWRRLSETSGRLPIDSLAAELACSRRHLASRFREQIGPSPKTVARILRFQRAMQMLRGDDGQRLSEIAIDCGYYDQAHFNRDFQQLAGTDPTTFVGSRLPDGFGVAA